MIYLLRLLSLCVLFCIYLFIFCISGPTTSNQLKEKLSEMKTKLADYITNSELMASGQEEERHITPSPGGKRYR